jgi:hypothetical protein
MNLEFQVGQLRLWLHLLAYLFAVVVVYQSFGWLGVAALGVLSHHPRQRWLADTSRVLSLQPGALVDYWRLPFVLACRSSGRWSWLFIDEVEPELWAQVRRFALLHVPAQPVGLSISR